MSPETLAQWGLVGSRFVTSVAAFGCAGALVLLFLIYGRTAGLSVLVHAVRRIGLTASIGLLVASLLRLLAQSYSIFGVDEGLTVELVGIVAFDTAWGQGWLAQVGVIALMIAGWALQRPAPVVGAAVTLAATVGFYGVWPLTSHAASHEPFTWFALLMQSAHTGGGGAWLGALGVFVVLLWRPPRVDTWDETVAQLIHVFSPLALGAAVIVAISGLMNASAYLGEWSHLVTTSYGRVLFLKLGAFGGVLGLGAWNWRRVRPTLGSAEATAGLSQTAGMEMMVALILLAITAVLVGLPLPTD